jgi:DinB superfamily
MSLRDTTLTQLRQSAADLEREVGRTPADAGLWRPKPGDWSAHECLTHLRDTEELIFLHRIRLTVAEDRPALALFDEEAYHKEHWNGEEPLGDMLAAYQAARAEIIQLLEAAPDWSRIGVHATRGPVSLQWQADYTIAHTWDHLSQMARVRLAREAAGSQ